jgi:hypothetical protein
MADQITIPTDLLAEVRADLEAGGDRAKRWRPYVATGTHVWVLAAWDDVQGLAGRIARSVMEPIESTGLGVEARGGIRGLAIAWAPIGDDVGGYRPTEGDWVSVLTDEGGDCPEPWTGHITHAPPGPGPVGAVMAADGHLALQEAVVHKWAILSPAQPTPGEASTPDKPHEAAEASPDAIPPGPWRVGGHCPRNLWIGPPRPHGIDVGRMDTPELAAYVVQAVNERDRYRDVLQDLCNDLGDRLADSYCATSYQAARELLAEADRG